MLFSLVVLPVQVKNSDSDETIWKRFDVLTPDKVCDVTWAIVKLKFKIILILTIQPGLRDPVYATYKIEL